VVECRWRNHRTSTDGHRTSKGLVVEPLIGAFAGALCGGVWSSLFGQPFSGLTGPGVFPAGMVFPGLVLIAPVTTCVGAALGALRVR
jgi:hypothetical protein